MKTRTRQPRTANETPFEKWAARQQRRSERVERELARKIHAWAKVWERCPLPGCRRNDRCLHSELCRAISHEPLTHEDYARIGEWLRPALEARLAEASAAPDKLRD